MSRMGCSSVDKLGRCQLSLLTFLSILAEDTVVLFKYLDSSFTKATSLLVVGC